MFAAGNEVKFAPDPLNDVAVTIPDNFTLLLASKVILLAVVLIPMVVMPDVLPST